MTAHTVEFEELLEAPTTLGEPINGITRDILNDLSVSLQVVAGDLDISLGELFSLPVGQVISLKQDIDQPMQLVYGDNVVAEGVLVAMEGKMGLKITSVLIDNE